MWTQSASVDIVNVIEGGDVVELAEEHLLLAYMASVSVAPLPPTFTASDGASGTSPESLRASAAILTFSAHQTPLEPSPP